LVYIKNNKKIKFNYCLWGLIKDYKKAPPSPFFWRGL